MDNYEKVDCVELGQYKSYLKQGIYTPFPIVYCLRGRYKVLPYLDLSIADQVWGFAVGETIWSKNSVPDLLTREEAEKMVAQSNKKVCAVLPTKEDFFAYLKHKDTFFRCCEILQKYGIRATVLHSEKSNRSNAYWIADEEKAVFELISGRRGSGVRMIKNSSDVRRPVRLILNKKLTELNATVLRRKYQSRSNVTPYANLNENIQSRIIETPYPLVYEKGQKIEVLPYLDVERKDEVWGIMLNSLLIKKTFERIQRKIINDTYSNIVKLVQQSAMAEHKVVIPDASYLTEAFSMSKRFDETVRILQNAGIQADKWNSYTNKTFGIWSSTEAKHPNSRNLSVCKISTNIVGIMEPFSDEKANLRLAVKR